MATLYYAEHFPSHSLILRSLLPISVHGTHVRLRKCKRAIMESPKSTPLKYPLQKDTEYLRSTDPSSLLNSFVQGMSARWVSA